MGTCQHPESRCEHCGEPILAVSEVCRAFETWAEACQTALPTDDEATADWRRRFEECWQFIHLAIRKSCLLDRLIYQREPIRTTPCPVHRGRWSGCTIEATPGCRCGHGSSTILVATSGQTGSGSLRAANCLTGWEPVDAAQGGASSTGP